MAEAKTVSIFDQSIFIKGDIFSSSTMDINGKVEGHIIANEIILKEKSKVSDLIIAKSVVLSSGCLVEGTIKANKIKILSGAVFNGSIEYCKLSIEDGAQINGKFTVVNEKDIENAILEHGKKFTNQTESKKTKDTDKK